MESQNSESVCQLLNFDITIRGSAAPYSVTASYRQRTAEGAFALDLTQEAWQEQCRRLGQVDEAPGTAFIRHVGSQIFQDLFRDQVRDLWIRARSDLETGQAEGVRLRLALHPPAVAALPWESLYDPDRNMAFGASGRTPLVRVENLFQHVGPSREIQASLPLHLLLAAPEDPTGLMAAQAEIQLVRQMAERLGPAQMQVTTLEGRFGILELHQALQTHRPDILYVASHGEPDGILLWQQDVPHLATSESLRVTLERATSVKLVFLNACLAGQGSAQARFTSVGSQLLQAGVPAVIAMQYPIPDEVAVDFARHLFDELLNGPCPGAIDMAVAGARSTLYMLAPHTFSYGTPILWLNAEDGRILRLPRGSVGSASTARPSMARPHPAPVHLDLSQEEAWLAELVAGLDLTRLPGQLRFIARSWEESVEECRSLLYQLRHLEQQGDEPRYAAKVSQYRAHQQRMERLRSSLEDAIRGHGG
ncbi:MAG: hypothetical protein KatS3mg050_1513 [Litorilinea sp.]|nr:MAG: hypothetical protein KatS3mg050_1513 [Litorilinea sp.]